MPRGAIFLLCLLSIAVRFWRIDAPFEDRWSWRQSDVAAIARNYLENGYRFVRPQIDWAGGEPGFVGTEFPLLPFTAALIYRTLGEHEWIGRVLTILFFAASLPFLFEIVRRGSGQRAAVLALLLYSFAPLMLAASRAFMPDMASLTCALAAYFFFERWAGSKERRDLLIAALVLALALLLKPTIATIFAPLAAMGWRKFRWRMFADLRLWGFAALATVPTLIWYGHALEIAREFYPHHMFGAGGVQVMNPSWYGRILFPVCTRELTPVLFVLALAGAAATSTARLTPFRWWLLAMVAFIIIVGYGNRHEWYRLPLVPIAAAFGGTALDALANKKFGRVWLPGTLLLYFAGSIFYAAVYFAPTAAPLVKLGGELRKRTPPGALIVVADNGDPTALYYGHRKGWHFPEHDGIFYGDPGDGAQLITNLEQLRRRGATHVAFYSATSWWLDYYPDFAEYLASRSTLLSASADYRIYELTRHP